MNTLQVLGLIIAALLVAGAVALLAAAYVKSRPRRRNPATGGQPDAPAPTRAETDDLWPADVRAAVAEIRRLTAESEQKMNERLGQLETRLAAIDEEIALLRRGAALASSGVRADPRRREILDLHRQGIDIIEIARRTDLDVGEVELILNLCRSEAHEQ